MVFSLRSGFKVLGRWMVVGGRKFTYAVLFRFPLGCRSEECGAIAARTAAVAWEERLSGLCEATGSPTDSVGEEVKVLRLSAGPLS